MFHKKVLLEKQDQKTVPVVPQEVPAIKDAEQDSDFRRLMYEQIALGNILADIEGEARLMWIPEGEGYMNQKRSNYEIKTKQTL